MNQQLYYHNSKGDRLSAVLDNPTNNKDKLIIIIVHGFSSYKDKPSIMAQKNKLINNNISTFCIDLYGHGKSDGLLADITVEEAVDDIMQAIEYLKLQGYKNIGLWGSSFSGLAASIVAAKTNDLTLLILKCPVSDYSQSKLCQPGEIINQWKNNGFRYLIEGDKRIKLNYSFYQSVMKNYAYNIADQIKVPTCIVIGDKDELVSLSTTKKLAELIHNSQLNIIKGANHWFKEGKSQEQMLTIIGNFITNHLKKI